MTTTRWVGCAARNFREGRPPGHSPAAIVIHRTGGTLAELRGRFANPAASVSAHYGVGRDGTVEQYVAEADTAFHAGIVLNPTWAAAVPGVNPNFYTIGIEFESGPDCPELQRAAGARLIAAIADRWAIEIDAAHVIPHQAIRSSAACPGAGFPLDDIIVRARRARDDDAVAVSTDEMELAGRPLSPRPPRGVAIDRTSLTLAADQYYGREFPKDLVVLHFTAGGTARSAVDTWRANAEHVATAFLVDTDGAIYEAFAPRFWAYHLGVKGGTPHERRSIGIEIVNVGPLQPNPQDAQLLNWWPPANSWQKRYCSLDESNRYVKATFRGKHYFAAFPDAQMEAVAGLVAQVCDEFGIPREPPRAADRLSCDPARFATFKGIATHSNFRPDKWDIGPAFDWERLGL